MTYNIQIAAFDDNAFRDDRRWRILEAIENQQPDFIGFQEAYSAHDQPQQDQLEEIFAGTKWSFFRWDDANENNKNAIALNTDRYAAIDNGVIVLDIKDGIGADNWMRYFDLIALAACTAVPRSHEVIGLHFRALNTVALPAPEPLPVERLATPADVPLVVEANHPEVFDDSADIPVWVDNGWVTLFEGPDERAGFGLCTPVGPGTRACDVGVRVRPGHQRQGVGAWIVQRMAARARSQGLVPVAGCGIENAVCRRTLERAGFVAHYRLLQFKL